MSTNYDLAKAIPNKLLNNDGSISTIDKADTSNAVDEYKLRKALPNKFLNPDGSYSTLDALLGKIVDTTIFIVVDTLPETGSPNKIYLVPNETGSFDEYFWNSKNQWDKIGALNVPMQAFENYPSLVTDGTTDTFFESVKALNLPTGTLLLGRTTLTDISNVAPNMGNEEMKVEIYPNNIIRGIMTSTNVSPYEWTIQWGQSDAKWIPSVISSGTETQKIDTNIEVANGKSIAVASEDGSSSSALSANTDGTITATVKVGEETTTEQVAYVSDIDKKVTQVLGGDY
nr:MAG TPA: hypothetical protein [Caudoviricetes sp.]